MSNLIATIILIVIFVVVFIILPVLAIQLFVYLAPVILVVYILYKIFAPKRQAEQRTRTHYNEPPRNTSADDVVDVEFTVHEVKDDDEE
ncbi:hypothetical protein AOC36_00630 [Erysipelothrix larvae]|uniref:Uncharacterized protein n=1 Tax=Erysipelothrix larvae TaxID=1514105 RepID=A0A0X8GYG9_9FIRM|nr:hypothetical protein [Erysipelothrix larvae]AMC92549.1 hypothetical protein AOC36_00630 [Erysipelothrix larvae]